MRKLRHSFFGLFAVLLLATLGTATPTPAHAADSQWHAPQRTPAAKKTPTASFELETRYTDNILNATLLDEGRIDLFAKKGAAAGDFKGATGTITLNGATRPSGKVKIVTTKAGKVQMLITNAIRKDYGVKTVIVDLPSTTALPTGSDPLTTTWNGSAKDGSKLTGDITFYNSSTNTSYKFAITSVLTQGPEAGFVLLPPATNPTTNVIVIVNKFNMVAGGSLSPAPGYVIPIYGGRLTLGAGGSSDALTFFAPGPVPNSTGIFTGIGTLATLTFNGTLLITEPNKGQTYGTWSSVAGT